MRRILLLATVPAVLFLAGCSSSAITASTTSSPTSTNDFTDQPPTPCSQPHANYKPVQGPDELVVVPKPGMNDQKTGNYIFNLLTLDGGCVVGSDSGGAGQPTLWLERGITKSQLTYVVDQLKKSGMFVSVTEQPRG
jgi:hypothetical protein